MCEEVAYRTTDLTTEVRSGPSGLKYAALYILHKYEKKSKYAKYGKVRPLGAAAGYREFGSSALVGRGAGTGATLAVRHDEMVMV